MIALVTFWFCYDDTLARLLDAPGVGRVPFFMWFWIYLACCFSWAAGASVREL